MELIRKQVRMNQMGKTVTDQFMIGGDYNVPDAKSDVGRDKKSGKLSPCDGKTEF